VRVSLVMLFEKGAPRVVSTYARLLTIPIWQSAATGLSDVCKPQLPLYDRLSVYQLCKRFVCSILFTVHYSSSAAVISISLGEYVCKCGENDQGYNAHSHIWYISCEHCVEDPQALYMLIVECERALHILHVHFTCTSSHCNEGEPLQRLRYPSHLRTDMVYKAQSHRS
jgi:hypothetical protein